MRVSNKINYICIFFGLITIFVGIFLIWTSFLIGGGFSWEFIPGVLLTSSGFAILLCVTFFNILKTKNATIISVISTIIIILFSFVFLYVNLSGSPYYSSDSPTVNCEIDFHNDTSNMIRWIVTQTAGDTISQDDCGLVLINSSDGVNVIEPNIVYQDKDNSNSITVGDIFEVYAPDDGFYTFSIIDERIDSLTCSYNKKY